MAISFTNATGNLFAVLGKLGNCIKSLGDYQDLLESNMIDTTNGVTPQLNAQPDIQALMGGSYIGVLSSTDGALGGLMQTIAAAILNRVVFDDNPRVNQNLTSENTLDSMVEVLRQMKASGASILAQTITATPSVSTGSFGGSFTGAGNGVIVASTKRSIDGATLYNSFAERLQVLCTNDSYIGGATEGNEGFTVTGAGSQSDVLAFDWPLGSNCQQDLNAIDGNSDNTNGNILTNSGFTNFTGNVPDNWEIVEGTAGTNIFRETTIVYDGSSSALRIQGVTGLDFIMRQVFGDGDDGTSGTLSPLSQYAFNIYLRRDGIAATGTLIVDLVDENNVVIQDAAGIENTVTIDLATLTTTYTAYNVAFRTPINLPETYYIRVRQGTPYTNGRSYYMDKLALGSMTQLYTSGPFLAVFSGGVPFQSGDYGYCTIANSRGAAGTFNTWPTLLQRLFFNLIMDNEILFPTSSTPTVQDAWIS